MPNIKDMEMPSKEMPEMEEDFDFGLDEEMDDAEAGEMPDLAAIEDDVLIEEMKKRGFEVEDVAEEEGPMPEEMPEEMDMEAEAPIV